jgi:hypothetical protein
METKYDQKDSLKQAKKKVRQLKIFYIHLAGYLVVVALILYNFYILGDNPYRKAIVWVNTTTLVAWTIFIALHAYSVFKGRLLFKKGWEEQKIKEYLKEDEEVKTTTWE